MKFLGSNRNLFEVENYNPGPGYYGGPADSKFNDIYKHTFSNNLNELEQNPYPFGKSKRFVKKFETSPGFLFNIKIIIQIYSNNICFQTKVKKYFHFNILFLLKDQVIILKIEN